MRIPEKTISYFSAAHSPFQHKLCCTTPTSFLLVWSLIHFGADLVKLAKAEQKLSKNHSDIKPYLPLTILLILLFFKAQSFIIFMHVINCFRQYSHTQVVQYIFKNHLKII